MGGAGTGNAMAVDVVSETLIHVSRPRVAAWAADPDHAPQWYRNIKQVEWQTPRPLALGSRITFVAHFLGRRLRYTYEITELVPGERLVMRTRDGPLDMETTYTWQPAPDDATRMTLRNRGNAGGLMALASPLMEIAVRRENRKDLAELKRILESGLDLR